MEGQSTRMKAKKLGVSEITVRRDQQCSPATCDAPEQAPAPPPETPAQPEQPESPQDTPQPPSLGIPRMRQSNRDNVTNCFAPRPNQPIQHPQHRISPPRGQR